MRRALLVAAGAVPVIALAVTAQSGQLLDTSNYNPVSRVSYVNEAQCTGADRLHLQWNIIALGTATFAQNDIYKIYASNVAPSQSGGGTFCAELPDTSGTSAGQVGSTPATLALESLDVKGADAATAANVPCDASGELRSIYVCAHWYDSSGATKKGWAWGTFMIQYAAPPDPAGLTAPVPGNNSLKVSWTANPNTPTATDHYVAAAFPAGSAPAPGTPPKDWTTAPVSTASTQDTTVTVAGLENGVSYDVIVVAYSVGGNPSGASASVTGQPVPTADFWDVYKDRGGVEQGGCTTGSAGALSVLGAAALLAIRRRKP